MVHRFGTHEEAALFVSMKRSEGYFAGIVGDQASTMLGPLAAGGVRVLVSEEAFEPSMDKPDDAELKVALLPDELSKLVVFLALGGAVIPMLLLYGPTVLVEWLACLLLMGLLVAVSACFGALMVGGYRAFRNEHHHLHSIVVLWVEVMVWLMVFALFTGIAHVPGGH